MGQFSYGPSLVETILAKQPDFAILDDPSGMTGIDAIRKLRSAGCPAKIVVLSTSRGKKPVIEALGAGADAYVFKDGPAGIYSMLWATYTAAGDTSRRSSRGQSCSLSPRRAHAKRWEPCVSYGAKTSPNGYASGGAGGKRGARLVRLRWSKLRTVVVLVASGHYMNDSAPR